MPVAGPIFHIVAPRDWPASGEYRPRSLHEQGFVHFSYADQVEGPANRLYRDEPELIVVEVDPQLLGCEVRAEDSYGEGTAYPHAYGPVPVSAAVAIHRLDRDNAGRWRFSPGSAGATPGR